MNEDMKVNTDEFFAVVFRKIKMDDLGLFVFKPIDVVVGKFIDDNETIIRICRNKNKRRILLNEEGENDW